MECRAYAICMDSQSGGHLGQDRKVPSKAGGNLSRMHKTEKTAKESRMNYMYSHLCDTTLAASIIAIFAPMLVTIKHTATIPKSIPTIQCRHAITNNMNR